jgi:hypothetical protein
LPLRRRQKLLSCYLACAKAFVVLPHLYCFDTIVALSQPCLVGTIVTLQCLDGTIVRLLLPSLCSEVADTAIIFVCLVIASVISPSPSLLPALYQTGFSVVDCSMHEIFSIVTCQGVVVQQQPWHIGGKNSLHNVPILLKGLSLM